MYSFTMYLNTDDTACPEEFRETKRMNTDFSVTQKSRILIYQNNPRLTGLAGVFIYPIHFIRV